MTSVIDLFQSADISIDRTNRLGRRSRKAFRSHLGGAQFRIRSHIGRGFLRSLWKFEVMTPFTSRSLPLKSLPIRHSTVRSVNAMQ
jgi:hypothetical protein